MKQKAFTLIELLVVIAIIGILSAIVLSSLNTARNKGADAATKADLDNARAQAENYYDSRSPVTYAGVCADATTGILNMLNGAQSSSGATAVVTTYVTVGATNVITCHDNGTVGWAAQAPLKSVGSGGNTFFCVDSTGTSTVKAVVLPASSVLCP